MDSVETFVKGSEKLTAIFGRWPSFHDSEIVELHLWRGGPASETSVRSPVLDLEIHVREATADVDPAGYYVLRHHTLTTLRFYDIDEFEMHGFNHQNVISNLSIQREEEIGSPSHSYLVEISSSFGMESNFKCLRIEVADAIPCSPEGKILPGSS
jgi:hypothetical protein